MLEDAMLEDEQDLHGHEVDGEVEVDVDGEYVVPVGQGGDVAEYFQLIDEDDQRQVHHHRHHHEY
jgi:hypothetical protein